MENVETLSDLLKCEYHPYHSLRYIIDNLIIDKDYYILDYIYIFWLNKVDFDFNSINFDIKLNSVSDYNRLKNICKNNNLILEKLYNYKDFEDFKINKFNEYIELLYIFENNNFIKEKIINDYDINSFEISNSDTSYLTLNTVKILNDKNFNFELLRLGNVVNLNINIIRYLI